MAQETSGRVKSAPVAPDADFYSLDCDSPSDLYWASNGLPVRCSYTSLPVRPTGFRVSEWHYPQTAAHDLSDNSLSLKKECLTTAGEALEYRNECSAGRASRTTR
jgi:hypothetical protein